MRKPKRSPYKNRVLLAPTHLTPAQRQLLINTFTKPERPLGFNTEQYSILEICQKMLEEVKELRDDIHWRACYSDENINEEYEDGIETAYWNAIVETANVIHEDPDDLHEMMDAYA